MARTVRTFQYLAGSRRMATRRRRKRCNIAAACVACLRLRATLPKGEI